MDSDIKYIGFTAELNKKCLDDICYELDKDTDTLTTSYAGKINNFLLKNISPYLIGILGEKIVQITETASKKATIFLFVLHICSLLFGGILLILIHVLKVFTPPSVFISFSVLEIILEFFETIAIPSFGGFFLFGFIYYELHQVNEFYKNSKCKNCSRNFAYKEFQKPLIKEVSTHDKYEKTITRYWRCKYCGDENIIEGTDDGLYNDCCEKGKRVYREKKDCKICENQRSLIEYRKPDIKVVGGITTTIRHYKCSHCGYYEISIQEEYPEYD